MKKCAQLMFTTETFLVLYRFVLLHAVDSWGIGVLFLLVTVHGVTFGGRMPLLNVIWGDFFGRRSMGSIRSLPNPFSLTANAIGPIFAAMFFDIYGSYNLPFYFFVVCFGLAGVLCLSMKPPLKPKR